MSISTAEQLEQRLMHALCRKFILDEDDPIAAIDKFVCRLLCFSRFFQDDVLKALFKFPAELIASKELFMPFLNSVCTQICEQDAPVEQRFFVFGAFIMNLTTVSFMMPCHRLIRDLKTVLPVYLSRKYFATLDVQFSFQYLELIVRQSENRRWLVEQLPKVVEFVRLAGENNCSTLVRHPDIATHVKAVHDRRAQNPENAMETDEPQICPYCNENCKPYLRPYLPADTRRA